MDATQTQANVETLTAELHAAWSERNTARVELHDMAERRGHVETAAQLAALRRRAGELEDADILLTAKIRKLAGDVARAEAEAARAEAGRVTQLIEARRAELQQLNAQIKPLYDRALFLDGWLKANVFAAGEAIADAQKTEGRLAARIAALAGDAAETVGVAR